VSRVPHGPPAPLNPPPSAHVQGALPPFVVSGGGGGAAAVTDGLGWAPVIRAAAAAGEARAAAGGGGGVSEAGRVSPPELSCSVCGLLYRLWDAAPARWRSRDAARPDDVRRGRRQGGRPWQRCSSPPHTSRCARSHGRKSVYKPPALLTCVPAALLQGCAQPLTCTSTPCLLGLT
jgi:hypothetical protein